MLIVSNLTKEYKKNCGIVDASFSVIGGSITAVVGPNGSGKTTLFQSLAGIILPDKGTALLDGIITSKIIPKDFAYLPESSYLPPNFTCRHALMYINQMRELGMTNEEIDKEIVAWGMANYSDQRISVLSQGMAKRVSIAATLMKMPKLVILDEPTNSLDTQGVLVLKKKLLELKKHGAVILISSHMLDFIATICDKAIFLKKGMVIEQISGEQSKIEEKYVDLFIRSL